MRDDDLFTGVLPFFHAAEERSFRKAAQRLGVTPAAVSKAVLKLEESLDVKLLARTSRTVSLTPEGALFVARCREAVSSIQAGRELMSESHRSPRGPVHVTMPFIVGRVIVPDLARLSVRYPELVFKISMTDRLVRLIDEKVDVAVRIGALESSSLVSRHLRGSRWVTVAAPSYVARRGSPKHPDELGRYDCLQFMAPNGRRRDWTFLDPAADRPFALRITSKLLIDQGEHMLEAAVAGMGVCQVLDFMVGKYFAEGSLVEVLGGYAAPGPPIQALTAPERSKSPNVRAILSFLSETFRRIDFHPDTEE